MDFAVLEPGLVVWVALLTGLTPGSVQWQNAARVQTNGRACDLSWIGSQGRGVDGTAWRYATNADPLQEMTPVSQGPRELTLQLSAETYSQRPGETGRAALEQLRDRLHWPSSKAALRAVGLALGSMPGAVTTSDYRSGGRTISRCLLEVHFNAVAAGADAAGRTSYLATAVVTPVLTDPAGDPLPDSLQPGGTLP